MNIGVISNNDKDRDFRYTGILIGSIIKKGGTALFSDEISEGLKFKKNNVSEMDVFNNSDIIICIGGDGTFLQVAREVYDKGIPLLGINLGNLGFLTEIDKNDIDAAVEKILSNKFDVEERMMLEVTVTSRKNRIINDIALNDVVISRASLSRILHLKTYINDSYIDSFPGDGLIVSSPTGSTAYSLSAGGPIVEPDTELIIVTPICPHILYSRSYITTANRIVKVTLDESYSHEAMITVDGQRGYAILGGDVVEIRKASQSVKIIRVNPRNFFNVLHTKIFERGEGLRKNEI